MYANFNAYYQPTWASRHQPAQSSASMSRQRRSRAASTSESEQGIRLTRRLSSGFGRWASEREGQPNQVTDTGLRRFESVRSNGPADRVYVGPDFHMGGEHFDARLESCLFWQTSVELELLPEHMLAHASPQDGVVSVASGTALDSSFALHKSSLRLLPASNGAGYFKVEFAFDATAPCNITVHVRASVSASQAGDLLITAEQSSATYAHEPGFDQHFSPSDQAIDLRAGAQTLLGEERFVWLPGSPTWPLIVHMAALDGRQSLTTIATIDGAETDRPRASVLKQWLLCNGTTYSVSDIYGMGQYGPGTAEDEALTTEGCIVCLSEPRDVVVLPCRHLCLCAHCADLLRNQANKCPLCRAKFHSLLRLRIAEHMGDISGDRLAEDPIWEIDGRMYRLLAPVPLPDEDTPEPGRARSPEDAGNEIQHDNVSTAHLSEPGLEPNPAGPTSSKGRRKKESLSQHPLADNSDAVINVDASDDEGDHQ